MHHRLFFFLLILGACVDRADAGAFDAPPPGADAGDDGSAPGDDGGAAAQTIHVDPATTALASGGLSTCAIDAKGGAWCWGDNTHGALGFGDMDPNESVAPAPVKGLSSGVRSLAGGPFAQCAILTDGTARCWGDSLFGDVGGETTDVQVPYPHDKTGLSNDVAQITFGNNFGCALTIAGRGKCWGYGGAGQLGNGSTDDAYAARDVASVKEPFVSISSSMGGLFACAVGVSGKVYCWGENGARQLGTNDAGGRPTPASVPGLDGKAVAVGAGRAHACALFDDGGVACWGGNENGQLGSGAASAPESPRRVAGITAAKALVVGADHSCATLADKSVSCFGSGDMGQIGAARGPTAPTTVFEATFSAIAVGAGLFHTCAMGAARTISCRGADDRDQIGSGSFSL